MVATILAALFLVLIISLAVFLHLPRFGQIPRGHELLKIRQSPQFRKGAFCNVHPTPNLTEGTSYVGLLKEFFIDKKINAKPPFPLPSCKTSLLDLDPQEKLVVWFGHSSYFIQVDGKTILVDPVFSGAASPVRFTTKSFEGTDIYQAEDMPAIDYLFISHDHWDHLDFETVTKLKPKIRKIICGLGVAAHLRRWGFGENLVTEMDWGDPLGAENGIVMTALSARHFSGRGLRRNKSLWISLMVEAPSMKLYLGGDSGYDDHFALIGEKYGPIDLAILECGQYDKSWKYIHMMPEETAQSATDLRATKLLPVHWGKFTLSNHTWDDPIKRVSAAAVQKKLCLLTPMIGEPIRLTADKQAFSKWWETEPE